MWSLSTGTTGRIGPESVVGFGWNGWSLSIGISGRIRLDYAVPGHRLDRVHHPQ
jgi:hypothetical protein